MMMLIALPSSNSSRRSGVVSRGSSVPCSALSDHRVRGYDRGEQWGRDEQEQKGEADRLVYRGCPEPSDRPGR